MHMRLIVKGPRVARPFDRVMVGILRDAITEARENLQRHTGAIYSGTGRLQASFFEEDTVAGAILWNRAEYATWAVEAKRLPPLATLVAAGVNEIAERMLRERADEIAAAMLADALEPLREVANG